MTPRSPDFRRNKNLINLIADTSTKRPQLLPETSWYQVLEAGETGNETEGVAGLRDGSTILQNSWVNSTADDAPKASFYLSDSGETRLRGKIKDGGDDTVAFVLPEQMRPEFEETFICPTNEDGVLDLSQVRFRAYQAGEGE